MFSRKLKGLGEIERYSGHITGYVMEWILYCDWPGYQKNGVWMITTRALRAWMKKHKIVLNPEPEPKAKRLNKQIKTPRRRW